MNTFFRSMFFLGTRYKQIMMKFYQRGFWWSLKRLKNKLSERWSDFFLQCISFGHDLVRYQNIRQPVTNILTELRFRWCNQRSYNFAAPMKKPKFPLHCHIEVTSRCNLTCPMCPRADIDNRDNGIMSMKVFERILNELRQKGSPDSLFLHLSGEPLINPKLPEMIKYAKEMGVPWIKFNTNITLLNDEVAHRIFRSGLDCIVLAMEISPEDQLKFRPGSNYGDVAQKVRRFMQLKKDEGYTKPLVKLQMLISKENQVLQEKAYREWKWIVDRVDFHPLHTVGGTVENYGETKLKRSHCEQLWTSLVFLWNGDTVPCCFDHGGKLKIGNALQQSIESIWNSPFLESLRQDDREGNYRNPVCHRCMNTGLSY